MESVVLRTVVLVTGGPAVKFQQLDNYNSFVRSCLKLVSNCEGAVVHLGSGYYGGDTGLHPRQIYYCGRRKNQCRCGKCDARCGPTNGCPCNACKKLLLTNSDGAVVHLGGGMGSGGSTGLPPNQVL
jgi:hypothetical protein